jgi:electron transfer flavoprotein alpha subunit
VEPILVLAHTEADGSLAKPALEALAAALALGGEVTVGLAGSSAQAAADRVASSGAVRFLAVTGPEFAEPRYSTDAAAAEGLCRASGAAIVIAPGTSRWSRALPGVTCRLGGRVDTHAAAIAMQNGVPAVSRWFYRQRMEAVLTRSQRPWIVLLDPGAVPAWTGAAGVAVVEPVEVEAPATRTTVVGAQAAQAGEQTIRPDAKLLFVAGAGWTKKQADGVPHAAEAEQLILDFLRGSQASLGGSKSLVDLSGEGEAVLRFMTHLNQIGQTGSTPRHPKGLSTCCHGEEPHAVGWRFISERRAINLDANCGWARGKADVLYVADAFAVMREVNRLLGDAVERGLH